VPTLRNQSLSEAGCEIRRSVRLRAAASPFRRLSIWNDLRGCGSIQAQGFEGWRYCWERSFPEDPADRWSELDQALHAPRKEHNQ
jgi:hypothetical protein